MQLPVKVKSHAMVHPSSSVLPESDLPYSWSTVCGMEWGHS